MFAKRNSYYKSKNDITWFKGPEILTSLFSVPATYSPFWAIFIKKNIIILDHHFKLHKRIQVLL